VRQLRLNDNPAITDAGMDLLQGMKSLSQLWVGRTGVTEAGLRKIKNFQNLTDLGLTNLPITDNGLENLESLTHLTVIYLPGTKITDAGLTHLYGLTKLQHVFASQTQVTDAGALRLCTARPASRVDLNGKTVRFGASPVKLTAADILISPDYKWTEAKVLGGEMDVGRQQADPFVTADGLELWFSSAIDGEATHLWYSKRESIDAPWGKPMSAGPSVNVTQWVSSPCFSADGLVMTFWRQLRSGNWGVLEIHRASKTSPWYPAVPIDKATGAGSPVLSADGLELIFHIAGKLHHMTRLNRQSKWSPPTQIKELFDATRTESRWLSPDSRSLLGFSTPDKYWLSQRPGKTQPWGARKPLDFSMFDPNLHQPFLYQTPVGLEFYFSTENGKIQRAMRIPIDG
jgi:hypothetical protein